MIKKEIIIMQDTRQQKGKDQHVLDYFQSLGIKVVRSKLYVGDYSLLDNMTISIDRKMNMLEIGHCICDRKEHERFKEELKNAQENNIKLYILIEDEKITCIEEVKNYQCPKYKSNGWKNGVFHRKGDKMSQINFEALGKAMKTMQERYGCVFLFAKRDEFGKKCLDILLKKL